MISSSLKKGCHFCGQYDRSTDRLMESPFLWAKSNVTALGGSRTSSDAGKKLGRAHVEYQLLVVVLAGADLLRRHLDHVLQQIPGLVHGVVFVGVQERPNDERRVVAAVLHHHHVRRLGQCARL